MYKRFLQGGDPKPSRPPPYQQEVDQHPYTEDDVVKSVRKCWDKIHEQCERLGETREAQSSTRPDGSWRTIRVFVSSTFTDFFNEREVLVKKVFPELREWCEERSLYLVECDLRWGVPKDSTTRDTICTCMEEIDRCHSENEGVPFFVNLTGERYGWIPSVDDVPEEVCHQYDWVPSTSITCMEIMHGAYRTRNPNAVFFLRDNTFCKELQKEFLSKFIDTESVKQEHLKVLKEELRMRFPDQVFTYSCRADGISQQFGKQRVKLAGLEEFAQKVQDFLRKAIQQTYPHQKAVQHMDPEIQEAENQCMYMEKKAEFVAGRVDLLTMMLGYANGDLNDDMILSGGDVKSFVRDPMYWGYEEEDNPVVCLSGPVGYGKSTVMSKLVQHAVKMGIPLFYHFVGCSSDSRITEKMYKRLVKAVTGETLDELPPNQQDCMAYYKDKLRDALPRLREENKPILVVIDAVNELVDYNAYNHLSWLPPRLPGKIQCVVSTADNHFPTVHRLQEHSCYHVNMAALSSSEARTIITHTLGKFSKTLAPDQMDVIMSRSCVDNPLWVWVLTEELRIYGDFRTLNDKVKSVSDSVDSLLSSVIKRLISEDETGNMKKALCVIACSQGGVPSRDITNLLGEMGKKEPLPPLLWAKVRRHLKSYIRTIGSREYVTFTHSAIHKAVVDTLLTSREEVESYHAMLADYYLTWSVDRYVNVQMVPYHCIQAGLKRRFIDFLRTSQDSSIMSDMTRAQYLKNMRCKNLADPVIPGTMKVVLCMACSLRKCSFAPRFHDNKSSCVVCGTLLFGNTSVLAHYCTLHSFGHSPQMGRCHVCNGIAGKDPDEKNMRKFGTVYGRLCSRCSFGIDAKKCCAILDN